MKMNLERIYSHLIYQLEDNGDWEYTREGIGIYEGRVFVVDLDDSGEEVRELRFVKEGMQVDEVLWLGKKAGVYVQEPSGHFYYNLEAADTEIKTFCEAVQLAVPSWVH
jgi:hypothetical protein